MARKLKLINNQTFKTEFPNAVVEVGDNQKDGFVPSCTMKHFDGETSLKVSYADRPYSFLSGGEVEEGQEFDKVILAESVHYPPYQIGVWYEEGDLLEYNDGLYEVVQSHTSQEDWPPDTTSSLYKTSTPPGVIAEWVQPEGSHDAYAIDTKVSHINKIWKSLVDANVWEPGTDNTLWEETDGQVDVEFYCIESYGEQNVSGFEFEIVLRGKPESNVVEMAIETQGLKFYYQPELTQAEIDEGSYRPENVIGSYAVYHATCGNMHKGQANAEKYKTGKAFHIYRPKVVGANGDWIWGELSIDVETGVLSITVDQQWLDSAVYPVRVDPTFGYTYQGSSVAGLNDIIRGSVFTGASGTAQSITAWVTPAGYGGDEQVKAAIYKASDKSLVGQTEEATIAPHMSAGEKTFNLQDEETISDIDYCLVGWGTYFHQGIGIFYDDGDTDQGVAQSRYYNGWPDTADFSYDDRKYSIYCTYEEGEPPIPVPVLTATQENNDIRLTWVY